MSLADSVSAENKEEKIYWIKIAKGKVSMVKEKVKKALRNNDTLMRILQYFYLATSHRNRLMQKKSYGEKNRDKTVLLIRPSTDDGVQGLMSLYLQALRWIEYANKNGYLPYVDYKNYKTQYYDGNSNAWDYYFTQPSDLSINDVYESKNVVLTGASFKKTVDYHLFRNTIFASREECERAYNLIWENIDISAEIKAIVDGENRNLCVENCLEEVILQR
jgi:hypothetical protein